VPVDAAFVPEGAAFVLVDAGFDPAESFMSACIAVVLASRASATRVKRASMDMVFLSGFVGALAGLDGIWNTEGGLSTARCVCISALTKCKRKSHANL